MHNAGDCLTTQNSFIQNSFCESVNLLDNQATQLLILPKVELFLLNINNIDMNGENSSYSRQVNEPESTQINLQPFLKPTNTCHSENITHLSSNACHSENIPQLSNGGLKRQYSLEPRSELRPPTLRKQTSIQSNLLLAPVSLQIPTFSNVSLDSRLHPTLPEKKRTSICTSPSTSVDTTNKLSITKQRKIDETDETPSQCDRSLTSYPSEGTEDVTFPLITVTINPLEQNEETTEYICESSSPTPPRYQHRLSIGSASSLDDIEDPESRMDRLRLNSCSVRRVSDISHINQLRREISGMSHLASEFYEIKKVDPDRLSLDSIHVRVLERCGNKYQAPEKSSVGSKWFVIITTVLTTLGITYGFWFKNFGDGRTVEH